MHQDGHVADQLLVLVWRSPDATPTDLAEQLVEATGPLSDAGTPVSQLNLADRHVDAAAPLRQVALDPQPEALVRIAGNRSAAAHRPVEALITGLTAVDRVAAYAVQTREPLTDDSSGSGSGARTRGWSQLALLRRAPGLDVEAFRERWLDHHTTVAIETQSTFRYVQHLVVQRLGDDAPPLDGIVEECFPAEAMTDPHTFFATGGDAEPARRADHRDGRQRAVVPGPGRARRDPHERIPLRPLTRRRSLTGRRLRAATTLAAGTPRGRSGPTPGRCRTA